MYSSFLWLFGNKIFRQKKYLLTSAHSIVAIETLTNKHTISRDVETYRIICNCGSLYILLRAIETGKVRFVLRWTRPINL